MNDQWPLRILMVSAEAPPTQQAEALQVGKLLRALRAQPGVVVDLITAATTPQALQSLSESLAADTGQASQIIAIPCQLQRWQRALIRLLSPWLAHRPDWWFLFAWRWRRATLQLHHRPDVIYSRSFPLSSTLAARQLARHYGVPWFLHLSDPWCECALHPHWQHSRWHQQQERLCFEAASRISFTSPITLQRYQQRYPELAHRMVVDPNTYDNKSINLKPWRPSRDLRLVHTGNFHVPGRLEILLKIISAIPANHAIRNDLRVVLAGLGSEAAKRPLEQCCYKTEVHGWINAEGTAELQGSADVLLSIDDRSFNRAIDDQYLSSKLVDYLAIRRPILVVTTEESANWKFIQEHGVGRALSPHNPQAIAEALVVYWQAWRQGDRSRFELPAPSPRYEASHVAAAITAAALEEA